MARKSRHVVPHKEGWAVKTSGASRASSVHKTQEKAIAAARTSSKADRSELFVHGKNGQIREKNTYGHDPYPPKG